MVEVEIVDDLDRLHRAVFDFLTVDEPANSIPLNALALALRDRDRPTPEATLAVRAAIARRDAAVSAAGICTRMNLLLAGADLEAMRAIGRLFARDANVHGVVGPRDAVRACVGACGRTGHEHMRLTLFTLASAPQAGAAEGAMDIAALHDLDTLVAWQTAFEREARLPDRRFDHRAMLLRRIEDGTCVIWRDAHGTLVSMAGCSRVPPGNVRIGPVYTPPQFRGRGYAQALVAGLSAAERARGACHVLLHADRDNPTSNAVYLRVGFRPIDEHLHFEFERP